MTVCRNAGSTEQARGNMEKLWADERAKCLSVGKTGSVVKKKRDKKKRYMCTYHACKVTLPHLAQCARDYGPLTHACVHTGCPNKCMLFICGLSLSVASV